MDTDSAYIALAGESIDDLVVDRENYFRHRSEWLPVECCDEHHKDYVNARISGHPWTKAEPCCLARRMFDKRTPGLFKVEWRGDGFVGLCSKTYYCFGATDKFSTKGLSKHQNVINKESFLTVLSDRRSGGGVNPCLQFFRADVCSGESITHLLLRKAQSTRRRCQYGAVGSIKKKKLKQQLFSHRYGSALEASFHLYRCRTYGLWKNNFRCPLTTERTLHDQSSTRTRHVVLR